MYRSLDPLSPRLLTVYFWILNTRAFTPLQLRDVCTIMCFVLADAAWDSFADKKEVTSANQEHMIQKVLQNLHWERKPRGGGRDEEDDWDRSRRRRAMVLDDDDDDVAEDGAVAQKQRRTWSENFCAQLATFGGTDRETTACTCTYAYVYTSYALRKGRTSILISTPFILYWMYFISFFVDIFFVIEVVCVDEMFYFRS